MLSIPSLGKILVLVIVIAAVWFGFRLIGRLDQARKQEVRRQRRSPAEPAAPGVEDTVKCRMCGAYVAARGASGCGRPDCPY